MKVVTRDYFLDAVEKGKIINVFGQVVVGTEKRIYGIDYTYDFTRASQGKICELVYTVIP